MAAWPIELRDKETEAFCLRHHIRKLSLFGPSRPRDSGLKATWTCWWSSNRDACPDISISREWR